jgi:hypothetical protein
MSERGGRTRIAWPAKEEFKEEGAWWYSSIGFVDCVAKAYFLFFSLLQSV